MQVREVMTHHVEVVRPDTTLQEAAQKMRSLDVGPLPVCDGERLVGMLTDRDITVRATAEGRDPKTTRVQEVMTPDVHYVYDDEDVQEAAQTMQQQQIRRVVVVNRDKRLVGIVSLGDLATREQIENVDEEVLEDVSTPSRPQR
jgi:CBS domain-containing protein